MPLPPLPENNTVRLWIDYTSLQFEHAVLFRFPSNVDAPTALAHIDPVLDAMQDILRTDDTIFGARYSAAGSAFSLPISFTTRSGNRANTEQAGDAESHYIDAIGRGTATGRKVRWTFFCGSADLPNPDPNRYQVGDNTYVDALLAALVSVTTFVPGDPFVCTIGLDSPVVYAYANTGYNYHWQKEQRT